MQEDLPHEETSLTLEEKQAMLAEHAALREKIGRARGSRKLRMLLDAPSPGDLVQSMPPQELLYTIKDIGLADSAEIVQLADTEQIRSCLDLDCWQKDHFDKERFTSWLFFLPAKETDAAEKVLQSMDIETLVFFFRDLFIVHELEGDDAKRDSNQKEIKGEYITTPDGFYAVEIPFEAEDTMNVIARAALDLFQLYGYSFCQKLFLSILHSLPSDLEESAYQFRRARIQDLGFIDYFDAIGIYQPLPPKSKPMQPIERPDEDITLPVYVQTRFEGLFGKAIQGLPSDALRERVQFELFYLTNKVLAADQVEPANPQAMRKVLRSVQQLLELGFEVLGATEESAATQLLAQHHVEWIFRSGYSALARLRKRAARLRRNKQLSLLEDAECSLLDSPYMEVIRGLKSLKPKFYTGIEPRPGSTYRPFRNLDDISSANRVLDLIGFLPTFFFQRLPFQHEELLAISAEDLLAPGHIEDVHFSHLFLTALAHFMLHGTWTLRPLDAADIKTFLQRVFVHEGQAPYDLDPAFQVQVEQALLAIPNHTDEDRENVKLFLDHIWQHLHEQAAFLKPGQALEPQYLDLFLTKNNTPAPAST